MNDKAEVSPRPLRSLRLCGEQIVFVENLAGYPTAQDENSREKIRIIKKDDFHGY